MNRVDVTLLAAIVQALVWVHSGGGQEAAASSDTACPATAPTEELAAMTENIHWLGHDSFRLEGGGRTIYIDPYQLPDGLPPADIILITHDHADHCSPEDVERIRTPETEVVTIAAAAAKLPGTVRQVAPGDTLAVAGVPLETVPAYNLTKFRSPGVPFHPQDAGHVGFVITVDGTRIYHSGDTDVIPEMSTIRCDVALLPVSGTYVMTAEEAAEVVRVIQPRVAIPMHVGAGIGGLGDAQRFADLASVPVQVLEIEK